MFKAETDCGAVLFSGEGSGAEASAERAAERYNESSAPGTPFAYVYGWCEENEEWLVLT